MEKLPGNVHGERGNRPRRGDMPFGYIEQPETIAFLRLLEIVVIEGLVGVEYDESSN